MTYVDSGQFCCYFRPVDVTNIYNDGQIKLVMRQDPEDQIPEYDDIFRYLDDSSVQCLK